MAVTERDKQRIDLAWKYFELHAKQRTTMFRYFAAMVPLAIGGYFYLFTGIPDFRAARVSLALIGLGLSVAFWLIDMRNEQLVDLSRKHLCALEARALYRGTSPGVFNAADRVGAPLYGLARFRCVMPTIYGVATLLFVALAIYSFC